MSSNDKYSFKQGVALICLLIIGGFLLYSLRSFLTAFLSALILYILLKPAMKFLCEKWKRSKSLSVIILLILSFITILLPLSGLSLMLSSKVNYVLNHSDELLVQINTLEQIIREKAGIEIFSESTMIRIKEFTANLIPKFLSKTLDMIGTIGILYFILFFLLWHYGIVEEKMEEMLPFSEANDKLLYS